MRILFLDMDGVMNSARYFAEASETSAWKKAAEQGRTKHMFIEMIDPKTVVLLNDIVRQAGCEIVISSSWRSPWTFPEIEWMLKKRGFEGNVIGATPTNIEAFGKPRETQRGTEIQVWLNGYTEVTAFCILDDSDDMGHLMAHLAKTTWADGLLPEHVPVALSRFELPRKLGLEQHMLRYPDHDGFEKVGVAYVCKTCGTTTDCE